VETNHPVGDPIDYRYPHSDSLFHSLPFGIVYQNSHCEIISANPEAEKILGLTVDQMRGVTSLDPRWQSIHEDGSPFPGTEHPAMVALRTGNPVLHDVMGVFNPLQEAVIWINVSSFPIIEDANNTVTGVYTLFEDISELKLAQKKHRESEFRFESLFSTMLEGVALHQIIYNPAGEPEDYIILEINQAFERHTGLKKEAVVNKLATETFGTPKPPFLDVYSRVEKTKVGTTFEQYFVPLQKHFLIHVFTPGPGQFATVFEDITERKNMEEALFKSEKEFRLLAEAMPQIVWITNPEGGCTYLNSQWSSFTGMTCEESFGEGWSLPIHPDDRQQVWDKWRQATQTAGTYQLECRMRRFDGIYHWWLVRGVPVIGADGNIEKWFGTCTDIEDIKRVEKELIENQELFTSIIDSTPSLIFAFDLNHRFNLVNDALAKFLGQSKKEVLDKTIHDVFPKNIADILYQINDRIMVSGNAEILEETVTSHLGNGESRFLITSKFPVRDASGSINGIGGVATDITERKQAEDALSKSRSQLETFIKQAPVCVAMFDRNMNYLATSDRWLLEFGRGYQYLIGRNHYQVHPDLPEEWKNIHQQSLAGASLKNDDDLWILEDGSEYWSRWAVSPWTDEQGEIGGIIISSENITERKQAETKIASTLSLLYATVNASADAVLVVDLNNSWVFFNQQFIDLWCVTEELVTMKDDQAALNHALTQLEDPEIFLNKVQELYATPCADSFDTLKFKNGKIIERYSTPQRIDNKVVGRVWSFRDITERKKAEIALHSENEKNLALLHNASDGIHILDTDGNVIEVSDSFCKMLGYQRHEMIGMNVSQWDAMYVGDELRQVVRQQFKDKVRAQFESRHRRKDGSLFDVEVSGFPLELEGKPVLFNSSRDITERKNAEKSIQLAASVFSHAREGIMITEPDGTIIDVNMAFSHITGFSREEVLGKNPRILSSGRQGRDYYTAMWAGLVDKGYWHGEIWNRRKDGEIYAEMLTISSVINSQGGIGHYVALFTDITAIKEQQRQLEHIAHYDALTNLPNRVLLADRLQQGMSQSLRRKKPLAVVYLDLDGFKQINDKHGHETGDQLLISVTAHMKEVLREGDTLARFGGDEFVAVLLDLGNIEACVPMLVRLLTAASLPLEINGNVLKVSASLGVTFYPQSEDIDADQLFRQADQAMYQAKLLGKNRYHIFDPKQDIDIRGHHESLNHILQGLNNNEFVLFYQPKVNMRSGKIIGVEALIRWLHPERGLLPPAVFLPVIEDHPLAIGIGEWVIETALCQLELWHAEGLNIQVSVNVGARQLQQADFWERLRGIMVKHPKILPGYLELEVLETSALEDIAHVSELIENCRAIGITFALDDFGTGYSSLTYLKRLPVTVLKIDQSFVRDMLDDLDDLAILEGVIGLANAFKREVIAEGVETVEHGELLLQLGCILAQGYGIAKPMPADKVPIWAANWNTYPTWATQMPVSHSDLPLLFASIEHRTWIKAIDNYFTGLVQTPPPHGIHYCPFMVWMEKHGRCLYAGQSEFESIEKLLRKEHLLVEELFKLKAKNLGEVAKSRLNELHELSNILLDQIKLLTQKKSAH
jgi:diguanylate cyclase (GGDEF)-like protein/PAS domain S-box-containing protein